MFIFFFKQKTAYEMRISDWSSDVCSSDLGQRVLWRRGAAHALGPDRHGPAAGARRVGTGKAQAAAFRLLPAVPLAADAARHAGAAPVRQMAQGASACLGARARFLRLHGNALYCRFDSRPQDTHEIQRPEE